METLSLKQARKLILLSQRLPCTQQKGTAVAATLNAIEHLGYIQMDTISVVQRAHHHTLWNRNPRYAPHHLDTLLRNKQIFEYWSHAAAYLPMRDFRYSLFRKHAIANGEQKHWYQPNHDLMDNVLRRIEDEGPLMARDFEGEGNKSAGWGSKPAKIALESLYMQGELMIPSRDNFHKVYDLTERVLPEEVDSTIPTPDEYARHLIFGYLRANGIGLVAEMIYLLKGIKLQLASCLKGLVENGEVVPVNIEGSEYYALSDSISVLSKPYRAQKLVILSPFDNLLIQRKRMRALFNFDYTIECYTPEAKRRFGYFCLPILWKGQLVGRMDCKAIRRESRLEILHLALEPSIKNVDEFMSALNQTLPSFLAFNGCDSVRLIKTSMDARLVCAALQ